MFPTVTGPGTAKADVGPWTIVGDTVQIDDDLAFLSATPHTLAGSGWVELELVSKVYSGSLDMVFGFDAGAGVTVSRPQVWKDNVPHIKERWVTDDVAGDILINGITAWEVLAPGSEPADLGNASNSKLVRLTTANSSDDLILAFNSHVQHSETSATFYYTYTGQVKESYTEYYPDFRDMDGRYFNKRGFSHQGLSDWSLASMDFTASANTSYKMRVWLDVPFTGQEETTTKYIWGVKPSGETLLEARDAGHLYLLDPWISTGWEHRWKLTIDSSKVPEDLVNFPILVKVSDSSGITSENMSHVFIEVGGNSTRIAFTESDGESQIYAEIDEWDYSNSTAWIWVKVPEISSTTDTVLYMYFDNHMAPNTDYVGAVGSTPGQQVWDNDFLLVDHLHDLTTSTTEDSTSNGDDGVKNAGANEPLEVAANISKGQSFTSITAERIGYSGVARTTATTNEYYMKTNCLSTASDCSSRYFDNGWYFHPSNGYIYEQGGAVHWGINSRAVVDQWTYLAIYWSDISTSSSTNITRNLTHQNALGSVPTAIAAPPSLGGYGGAPTASYNGTVDEFRISSGVRSQSWREATYYTLADNLVTYSEHLHQPLAPTSFTLTDLGGVTVEASWSGATVENLTSYLLLVDRDGFPDAITGYETAYSGNATSVNLTGFSLDITKYYFSLWVEDSDAGYSDNYITASIGGEDMESIATALTTASTTLAAQLTLFVGLVAGFLLLIPLVWLSWLSFKNWATVLFMLTAGLALMTGLYWFNAFGTMWSLAVSIVVIIYSFLCIGFAVRCLFLKKAGDVIIPAD